MRAAGEVIIYEFVLPASNVSYEPRSTNIVRVLLTDIEHPVQLNIVRSRHGRGRRYLIVDEQTKHGGRYLQQVYRVPIVVAIAVLRRVPKTYHVRARPDVDEYVAVDQFSECEVVVLSTVVEEQSRRMLGLKPEVHFHSGVRF